MGWDHARDIEETALVSGGRHVYEAPTPYKKFSLQYKGGTTGLQHIIDTYTGVYGRGPYYALDFNYAGGNQLPTRWASAYMLKEIVGGWCAPLLTPSTAALAGEVVTFTNLGQFTELGETLILPCVPETATHLRIWGSRTGTAAVRVYLRDSATGVWGDEIDVVPSSTPTDTVIISGADAIAGKYNAIKLRLRVPSASSLTLDHLNLMDAAAVGTRQPGLGVGGMKFVTTLSGNIQTKAFDRIGLALDLVEVE
jgi:hypothetical protein